MLQNTIVRKRSSFSLCSVLGGAKSFSIAVASSDIRRERMVSPGGVSSNKKYVIVIIRGTEWRF